MKSKYYDLLVLKQGEFTEESYYIEGKVKNDKIEFIITYPLQEGDVLVYQKQKGEI